MSTLMRDCVSSVSTRRSQLSDAPAVGPKRRAWRFGVPSNVTAKLAIVCMVAAVIFASIVFTDGYSGLRSRFRDNSFGWPAFLAAQTMAAVAIFAFLWRFVCFMYYRSTWACADHQLPVCTVVVPAYNEGRLVLDTLRSLAGSNYPKDKLHIVAVDDGSKDDTWHWMQQAEKELPGRIRLIKQARNTGKRGALYTGFMVSSGEIIVTVDSDSTVDPDTIRHLVSPFVRDSRVGAVAGNVRVLNKEAGIIPRMLDVSYMYSFDFIRAGQSSVSAVMCTPGALSAYRRDIVFQVLPEWLHQTFCGRPAKAGEDHAMTNLILRNGFKVKFQHDAVVYTKVPTEYQTLCKMFLRWARSNVRETIVLSRFAFTRFRDSELFGPRVNLVLQWIYLTLPILLRLGVIGCFIWQPLIFGIQLLAVAIASSVVPAIVYGCSRRSTDCLWAFVYGPFWALGLSWIKPYALMTAHKSAWMTRDISQPVLPAKTPGGIPAVKLPTEAA